MKYRIRYLGEPCMASMDSPVGVRVGTGPEAINLERQTPFTGRPGLHCLTSWVCMAKTHSRKHMPKRMGKVMDSDPEPRNGFGVRDSHFCTIFSRFLDRHSR